MQNSVLEFENIINKYPHIKSSIIKILVGDIMLAEVFFDLIDKGVITLSEIKKSYDLSIVPLVNQSYIKNFSSDIIDRIWNMYISNESGYEARTEELYDYLPENSDKILKYYLPYVSTHKYYFPKTVNDKMLILNNVKPFDMEGGRLVTRDLLLYILDDNIEIDKSVTNTITYGRNMQYSLLSKKSIEKIYHLPESLMKYNFINILSGAFYEGVFNKYEYEEYLNKLISSYGVKTIINRTSFSEILNVMPDILLNKNIESVVLDIIKSSGFTSLNYSSFDFVSSLPKNSRILAALRENINIYRKDLVVSSYKIEKTIRNMSIIYDDTVCLSLSRDVTINNIVEIFMYASEYGLKLSQNSKIFAPIRHDKERFFTFLNNVNNIVDTYGVNDKIIVNFAIDNKVLGGVDENKIPAQLFLQKYRNFLLESIV